MPAEDNRHETGRYGERIMFWGPWGIRSEVGETSRHKMFPYLSGKKGLKVAYSNSAIPQPSHKASSGGFEELNPSPLCWRNGNLVQMHIIDSGSCQIVTTTVNRATEGERHWQKDLMPLTTSMEDWIHKLLHSRLGVHSGAPEESTG